MPDALALVDDIFFQAKMTETARQTGVELKTFSNSDALLHAAAENPGATLLLDLNSRGGKPLETLARLRELARSNAAPGTTAPGNGARRRVIAFLSHVQTDLAEQARAAGCDEVMPRSKFTAELPRILREACGG
jgi:DNA-binding NarL/FixJ family response regulator